jgi:hypothetical protein
MRIFQLAPLGLAGLLTLGATTLPGSGGAVASPLPTQISAYSDQMMRSCRRQVRQSLGITAQTPRMRAGRGSGRLPRVFPLLVNRCLENGGRYT